VNQAQANALVKLLREGDPQTTDLVREQLHGCGEEWIDDLQRMAGHDDHRVSEVAREILGHLQLKAAREDFSLFCRFFPEDGNLEEACWQLSRALDPHGDVESAKRHINEWGRNLLLRISGAISTRERVKILTDYMGGELCFRGNAEDYYNARNSLLPRVIEARRGLPISLSCIAIFLSHRAGMNVVGVNLPGHFIVRHGDVLFDPFHQGRILTEQDCGEILRCQGVDPTPDCFTRASSRRILQRILSNLHFVFSREGRGDDAEAVKGWLCALRRVA
jgi:regulator of sirC expression with transglutaminase-like and TPR domain